MSAILTIRLDEQTKERGTAVLREQGITPSAAVQQLFDYIVRYQKLPFSDEAKPDKSELKQRIADFDSLHTKSSITATDDEIRYSRLKEHYGLAD